MVRRINFKEINIRRASDHIVAVVCGAATKAHIQSEEDRKEYIQSFFEKGQVPNKALLRTIYPIEFIYEGYRYKFTATKSSNDSYTLFLNGTRGVVGVRSLSDGGLLCAIDGEISFYLLERRACCN